MNRYSLRQIAFFASLTLLFCGTTQAVTIQDNFDDNSIDTALWRKGRDGGMNVKERNQRLELSANGNTGANSFAFIESRDWGINWKKNFTLSIDYHFLLSQPTNDKLAAVGFGLSFDGVTDLDSFTGVTVGIQREVSGLYLLWVAYEDGEVVNADARKIQATDGELKLEWNKANDRLTMTAGGKTLHLEGVYDAYGDDFGGEPVVVTVGGLTANGNLTFSGSEAYLDNFKFVGKTRPR